MKRKIIARVLLSGLAMFVIHAMIVSAMNP